MNILNKYKKSGVITTGDDNVQLDTPTFEVINIRIDTVERVLEVDVLHEVTQGSLKQKHQRTFKVNFADLPASVKTTGKAFLDAIETEILKLPQYEGSVKQ